MNNACCVGRDETISDLARQIEQLLGAVDGLDGYTLDKFHNQVIRPDIIKLRNVRVIQRGNGSRFTLEAFGELVF